MAELGSFTTTGIPSRRRTIITGAGEVEKTRRTTDSSGRVTIRGKEREEIREEINILMQEQALANAPAAPTEEEMAAGMSIARVEDLERAAQQSLARQEDFDRARDFSPLSEGTRQRQLQVAAERTEDFRSERIGGELQGLGKPVSFLDPEFYTPEGQQQRRIAIEKIFSSFVDFREDTGNEPVIRGDIVTNPFAANIIETGSRNPFETAFVATGFGTIGKGTIAAGKAVTARVTGRELTKQATSKTAALISGVPSGIAASTAAVRTSQGITGLGSPEVFEKQFREAIGVTFERQREQLSTARGVAFEITPFAGDQKQFQDILRQELTVRGFTGARLEGAVSAGTRLRTATGVGEATGQIFLGATTEKLGRAIIGDVGERVSGLTGRTAFRTAFRSQGLRTLPAGFVEGVGAVKIQDIARVSQQERSLGELGAAGVIGAASAGVLGGIIGARTTTGPQGNFIQRALGKGTPSPIEGTTKGRTLVNVGANIADIFEKPGDLLADFTEFSSRGFRRKGAVRGASLLPSTSFSQTAPFSQAISPAQLPAQVNPFTQTQTPAETPAQILTPTSVTPAETREQLFTRGNSITDTFTQAITETPAETPTQLQTTVAVPNIRFPIGADFIAGGFGGRPKTKGKPKRLKKASVASLLGAELGVGVEADPEKIFTGAGVRR